MEPFLFFSMYNFYFRFRYYSYEKINRVFNSFFHFRINHGTGGYFWI
ncbi:hypothetical protein CLV48_11092 [Cecembia rubra]|uniref:Uncharacterized protein n=1 Tax=Cecembia rubra TaxID=1485585 RepID=A0A2P8DYL7_9BACT|nr:hypothetical protein CLV48_11092 [Cecembia rubra]